jgi:hypothetical protein
MSDKKDPSKSPRYTAGPVVKTGPTHGQNRSRNKDGSWHKKRSDAGKPRKKSGCFLTTAVCSYKGLPDNCHELQVLRLFRDEKLLRSRDGRVLVEHYYAVAPAIVERLSDPADLEGVWQTVTACVEAIQCQRFGQALRDYEEMVASLGERLGVAVSRPSFSAAEE